MARALWYGSREAFERAWQGASSIDDVCVRLGLPEVAQWGTGRGSQRFRRQKVTKVAHALRAKGAALPRFAGSGKSYNKGPRVGRLTDDNATRIGTVAEAPIVAATREALAGRWQGTGPVPWHALAREVAQALGYGLRDDGISGGRRWFTVTIDDFAAPEQAAVVGKGNCGQRLAEIMVKHHDAR